MAKTERLRNKRMHRSIHSTLEQTLEVIKRVQACRGEEIVNAQNRARAGNPANTRIQEDKGEAKGSCGCSVNPLRGSRSSILPRSAVLCTPSGIHGGRVRTVGGPSLTGYDERSDPMPLDTWWKHECKELHNVFF